MWYAGFMRWSRVFAMLFFFVAFVSLGEPVFAQLQTLKPLPTSTPVPPTLVPKSCIGTKCASAGSCPKYVEKPGSEQCLGRTQTECGDCYFCSATPTSGPCTGGWSGCSNEGGGMWCRSRQCPPDLKQDPTITYSAFPPMI